MRSQCPYIPCHCIDGLPERDIHTQNHHVWERTCRTIDVKEMIRDVYAPPRKNGGGQRSNSAHKGTQDEYPRASAHRVNHLETAYNHSAGREVHPLYG